MGSSHNVSHSSLRIIHRFASPQPTSHRWKDWVLTILLLGGGILAGCSTQVENTVNVLDILSKAHAAPYKDLTCTIVNEGTLAGSPVSQAPGSCLYTRQPERVSMTVMITTGGETVTDWYIYDKATDTTYEKAITPGVPSREWMKSAGAVNGSANLLNDLASNLGLTNPTLAGTETINGHQVYHLYQEFPLPGNGGTFRSDEWVRTDNYYPAQLRMSEQAMSNGSAITGGETITFTQWDSGVTIPLPSI